MKHWLRRIPGLMLLARAVRTVIDPTQRNFWVARVLRREPAFQPSPHTKLDRYPAQFGWVTKALADVAKPRLLSFGCSTGEELHSLRRYFPTAEIKGIDINRTNVIAANAHLSCHPDPGISVQRAGSAKGEPSDHYDAIFAMAVFRNGALDVLVPDECSKFSQFVLFEEVVNGLVECLRPGGFLAIAYAHFRIEDCTAADNLERVWDNGPLSIPQPVYDRDNRRVPTHSYNEAIFRRNS